MGCIPTLKTKCEILMHNFLAIVGLKFSFFNKNVVKNFKVCLAEMRVNREMASIGVAVRIPGGGLWNKTPPFYSITPSIDDLLFYERSL